MKSPVLADVRPGRLIWNPLLARWVGQVTLKLEHLTKLEIDSAVQRGVYASWDAFVAQAIAEKLEIERAARGD